MMYVPAVDHGRTRVKEKIPNHKSHFRALTTCQPTTNILIVLGTVGRSQRTILVDIVRFGPNLHCFAFGLQSKMSHIDVVRLQLYTMYISLIFSMWNLIVYHNKWLTFFEQSSQKEKEKEKNKNKNERSNKEQKRIRTLKSAMGPTSILMLKRPNPSFTSSPILLSRGPPHYYTNMYPIF